MKSVSQIIKVMEKHAPSGAAEQWDNVGLIVGDPEWPTSGAVISVDLSEQAVDLAKKRKFKLIINHHPCIFPHSDGLRRIINKQSSQLNALIFEAMKNSIAIVASHTNFDRCALEVVRKVSEGLNIVAKGRLVEKLGEALVKLTVFVPVTHVSKVRDAICSAGAGHIGAYDLCTFGAEGEGSFRGGDLTKPFIGKVGRLETVNEIRLETVLPRSMEEPVLSAMLQAHPYEEVAYDLYPVEQVPSKIGIVRGIGYGFWGDFPSAKLFSELAKDVKRIFSINGFLMTGVAPSRVKRIAFVAGKGASFVEAASKAGCDVFITGEAGYHNAMDGARRGMAVVEVGHRESESFFAPTVGEWLSKVGVRAVALDQPMQAYWPGGKR
ncbi:MAG: Nif3-like dinuclear metal center hexameric protein [Bdellovibrionota bacterium]